MKRFLRVVLILIYFVMGVLLMYIPWSGAWERNYFLNRYPALSPYLLNPSVRGAITGLGVLDITLAAGMLRRRSPQQSSIATRS